MSWIIILFLVAGFLIYYTNGGDAGKSSERSFDWVILDLLFTDSPNAQKPA